MILCDFLSLWKLIGSISCPSENSCPSFLELMISSHLDYSFNILFFFFEEYFCTLLRHSDFFLISVIFLIFMNSIPMPLKKNLHPFAVFIFCYLSGDITERCLFFFFFSIPQTMLVSSIFLFLLFVLYYLIVLFVLSD